MFLLWSHCDHLINRRQVRCIVLQGVTGIDRIPPISFPRSVHFFVFLCSFSPFFFFLFSPFPPREIRDRGRDLLRGEKDSPLEFGETFLPLAGPIHSIGRINRSFVGGFIVFVLSFPVSFRAVRVTFFSTCVCQEVSWPGSRIPMICTVHETSPLWLIYIQNSTFSRIPY